MRTNLFAKMTFATIVIAFSVALGPRAHAADCSANVRTCINLSKDKPDAVARCQAAGQSCAKTGTFVGPYSGQTYAVGGRTKCGRWGC